MPANDDIEHCKDCCCARSWKALGITEYTGKSIPEHITALLAEVERLKHKLADEIRHSNVAIELCNTDLRNLRRISDRIAGERDEARAQVERLKIALRYWLPDETMIPAGHEVAWWEHVELIPEHRTGDLASEA